MSTTNARDWTVRGVADLGRAVAGVRRAQGLSQEELADQTMIDRTYLAKLEAGAHSLYVERALLALRRMGATVTVTLPQSDGTQD